MYLGEYEIDEYIDIVAATHRFSSGAAYAPSSITYRVYEDGGTTEIISDTAMTNFDSVTGFYYDRVQLTAAAGFEVGKSYVVLIQATVDSVAAIDWRSFRVKFPAVNAKQISGSATAADNLEASALGIVTGAAATGTLSTTQMTTNLTEATDDHYNGRIIVWTSGVLAGQATDITDYDGSSKMLTYTAVTEAPGNGDTFVIV